MLANIFQKSLFSASGHRFWVFGITISSLVGCCKRAPTMNEHTFIYIFIHIGSLSRAAFCLIPYQHLWFVNTCTELSKANSWYRSNCFKCTVANIARTGKSEEGVSLNCSYINANLLNGLNLKYWEAVVFFKTQLFQTYYFCQVNT